MKNLILLVSALALVSCGDNRSHSTRSGDTTESKFVWDFSKERTFIYSFSQEVQNENNMGRTETVEQKTYMTATGHLHVRVKDNNLADLSFIDIKTKMVSYEDDGTPGDTIAHDSPLNIVQDMKPDGSFDDSNSEIMFGLLFPLPNIQAKEGESGHIPMKLPFNANGSRLFAKGQNTLTFTGFEEVEGITCAVLEGEIDVSDLDVPEELTGEYESSMIGEATYYFDLKNGYYVGADIHMQMAALMDSEIEGEENFGRYMEIKSDNIYTIRLEKIEE